VTERLQKVLARHGVASRRAAERMIEEGRVTVNGKVITRLGSKVDPALDAIKVDGRRLAPAPVVPTYLMLNKPKGYVTTLSDPDGRRTVADLITRVRNRVFPVGRLDFNSEGLLLLTDDGDLAQALMHPRKGVEKTYMVKVRGRPEAATLRRLALGVRVDERKAVPSKVRIVRPEPNSWLEVSVVEGRKHLVRRMLEAVGHPVSKLRRIRYGGLRLGSLPLGEMRPLTSAEVEHLRRVVGSPTAAKRPLKDRRS
jgi:23S rRNA pseudouridine2605 synthase